MNEPTGRNPTDPEVPDVGRVSWRKGIEKSIGFGVQGSWFSFESRRDLFIQSRLESACGFRLLKGSGRWISLCCPLD
jgi:hypothetical protein